MFGGEGLFFATLRGPGKVWIQSLPFSRLADRVIRSVVQEREQAKDTYYEMAGWDVATGTPKRVKLEELGLAWVADELGL